MPIIGLNLGKSGFKAVEITKKKEKLILTRFGAFENFDLDFGSKKPEDRKVFAKAIENFFTEVGFNSRNVVVGLEEKHVYMCIVPLPVMKDKELKNSIQYEAEQYIPLPLAEVSLTYKRIEGGYVGKDRTLVQLVAAKKSILNEYIKVIKGAHLVPKAIEPEAVALGRALGDTSVSPLGTIILDIGRESTIIIVVYGGTVQFTRTLPIGGNIMTKSLQQSLNLDSTQAEEYKKVYGMEKQVADGRVEEVIRPMVDKILTEVRRAAIFFTNQNPSANIKKAVLSGGSALMPGLLPYVANNLDLEVEIANPLRYLEISPDLESNRKMLLEKAPIFSTAVGLALKET